MQQALEFYDGISPYPWRDIVASMDFLSVFEIGGAEFAAYAKRFPTTAGHVPDLKKLAYMYLLDRVAPVIQKATSVNIHSIVDIMEGNDRFSYAVRPFVLRKLAMAEVFKDKTTALFMEKVLGITKEKAEKVQQHVREFAEI
jgi:hypothetical protein